MLWLNKYHRGFNRLWLVFSIVGAFAFVGLNVLMGGYKGVYPLNPYFIPERTKAKTTEAENQRINSDETLDAVAKDRIAEGLTLDEAIADIPQEDRDVFKRLWYEQVDKRQKTKVWQARGRFVRDLLGAFIMTFAIGHGVFYLIIWIIRGFR